jgi:hypothetical protein
MYTTYNNNNNNNNNTWAWASSFRGYLVLCICGSEGPAHSRAVRLNPDVTARAIW